MTESWISKVRISSAWGCSPRTWGREEIRSEGVSSFVEAFMITIADLLVFTFFLLLSLSSVDSLLSSHVASTSLFYETTSQGPSRRWEHSLSLSLSLSCARARTHTHTHTHTHTQNVPYITSQKKIRQERNARHEFLDRLPVCSTLSDISSQQRHCRNK